MLSRVGFSSIGQSYWQKGFENRLDNPNIRQDFVDVSETYVKIAIIAMIPLGCLLNLIAWRWRKFANAIIYYELLSNSI